MQKTLSYKEKHISEKNPAKKKATIKSNKTNTTTRSDKFEKVQKMFENNKPVITKFTGRNNIDKNPNINSIDPNKSTQRALSIRSATSINSANNLKRVNYIIKSTGFK